MGWARRTLTRLSGAGSAGGFRVGTGSRGPTLPLPGPSRPGEPRVSDRLLPVDVDNSGSAPKPLQGGARVWRGWGGGENGKTLHQAVYAPPLLVVVAVGELDDGQGAGGVRHGRASPDRGRGHGVYLRHGDARAAGVVVVAAVAHAVLFLVDVGTVAAVVEGQHLRYGADAGGGGCPLMAAAGGGGLGAGGGSRDAVVLDDVSDDGPAEAACLEVVGHVLAPLLDPLPLEGRQVDANGAGQRWC